MNVTKVNKKLKQKGSGLFRRGFALLLCAMFLLTTVITVSAQASDDATLSSITIADYATIDFEPGIETYTIDVPYRWKPNNIWNFYIPTVVATTSDPDASVGNIVYPTDLSSNPKIEIPVTAADGVTTKTYTINLNLIGKNMFNEPGFEYPLADTWWMVTGGTNSRSTDIKYAGNQSIVLDLASGQNYSYHQYNGIAPVLKTGVKYFSSLAIRGQDGMNEKVANQSSATTSNSTFVAHTYSYSSTWGCYTTNVTDTWTQHFKTITPTKDINYVKESFGNYGIMPDKVRYVDEQYIGELIIADVQVYDAEGKDSYVVPAGESGEIELSYAIKNQFDNAYSMENETVSSWTVEGPSAGVTVNDGIVTISGDATEGKYYVRANVIPSFTGGHKQSKICGTYVIDVIDPSAFPTVSSIKVKVGDTTAYCFDGTSKEVDVYVPYRYTPNDFETFDIPTKEDIIVIAEGNSVTIDDSGATIGGKIIVNVTNEDNLTDKYTINLKAVGKNLYLDGGMESIWNNGLTYDRFNHWKANNYSLAVSESSTVKYAGNYSLKNAPSSGYSYISPKDATPLKKDITYMTSMQIRLVEDSATAYKPTERINPEAGIINRYSNGIKYSRETATITSDWTQLTKIIRPTADIASFYDTYTTWATDKATYVDEYYVGELVVADVSIKEADDNERILMEVPQFDETITLTSELKNQFGNTQGLEGIVEPTWTIEGPSDGVTVDNGVVTVTPQAKGGVYYVLATVEPGFNGGVQNNISGIYEINVVDNRFVYDQDNVEITEIASGDILSTLRFTNMGATTETFKVIDVVYVKKLGGMLSLYKSETSDEYTVEAGESIVHKYTINIPTDNNEYVVKSFAWASEFRPVITNGVLK